MDVSFILDGLNEAQRDAVTSDSKKLLVLAGAGSGKTKVLVHRIAWLNKALSFSTHSILAVTFTNKAASEMKGRIEEILEQPIPEMWCGTFHSISNRLLRRHFSEANLDRDFAILDSDDQLRVIKRILKILELDDDQWVPEKVRWQINTWKDDALRPKDIDDKGDFNIEVLKKIYIAYEKYLEQENLVDFNELILRSYELIRDNAEIRSLYQKKFRCVLVDEFQDTNTLQYKWMRNLLDEKTFVTTVGDDDQSIYGWRGAKIENINHFAKDKGTEVTRLEQNYRSTSNILDAANAVIDKNTNRLGKKLWTALGEGDKIDIFEAYSEQEEASYVSESVHRIVDNNDNYKEVAVLYRSNAQSRVIEEYLLRNNIPYVIYGGVRFYERLEIKNVVSYLRLIVNKHDNTAFERAIGVPSRGVGEKTIESIRNYSNENNLSLFASSEQMASEDKIKGKAQNSIKNFTSQFETYNEKLQEISASELVEFVINHSGLIDHHMKESGEKGKIRVENINELITAVKSFEILNKNEDLSDYDSMLAAFLSSVSLDMGETQADKYDDAVQLMTIHSAKGLEFKHVFLVGMEENLFPHSRSVENISELEEERRLCYVGITRARQKLYLSYAEYRRMYGNDSYNPPSRFIKEIPDEHTDFVRPRQSYKTSYYGTANNFDSANENSHEFSLGDSVVHEKFGLGTILSIEGEGELSKVQVNFADFGTKWLVLGYANLEKTN